MTALSFLSAIIVRPDQDIHSLLERMVRRQAGEELRTDQRFVDNARGIGLSASGGDPGEIFHWDADRKLAVAFTGRITNASTIRENLKKEGTGSGLLGFAGMIAHLYLRYGDADWVNWLHGYFCFLLWDERKRQLLAVRDQMGSFPLFFAEGKRGATLIASNISALMVTGLVSELLDEEAVAHYLHDKSFLQPSTPYKAVRSLPPGVRLLCGEGKLQTQRYYKPKIDKEAMDEYEAISQADTLLCKVLEEQIAPFEQLGVCFSGGVDSLLITAMLKALTDKPICTYTVWAGNNMGDVEFAQEASKYFGTQHTMIELNGDVIREYLPEIIAGYPTPAVGGWQIFMSTRSAREDGIDMAFSGHGAEIPFGIDWHQKKFAQLHSLLRFLDLVPISAQKSLMYWLRRYLDARNALNKRDTKRYNNLHLLYDYLERRLGIHYWNSSKLTERRIATLLACDTSRFRSVGDIYRQNYLDSGSKDFIDQMLFARLSNFEGNHAQGKNNYLAQCNHVELALPFMDRRILEFGFSIPNKLKTLQGEYKYLEVKLAKRYHNFIREKAPFSMSFDKWLCSDLTSVASQVFSVENIERLGIFRPEAVCELWNEFLQGRGSLHWTDLQAFISLDLWLRQATGSV